MAYTPQSWVTGDQVTADELTSMSNGITSASSGIADMSIDQSTSHLQVTLADGDLVDAGAVPAATDATVAPILQNTASASYAAAQSAAHAALDTTIAGKVAKDAQVISLTDHVTNTGADLTSALQTFFTALDTGSHVIVTPGTYVMDGTVTCAASNITVTLLPGATIDRSNATATVQTGLSFSGDNVTFEGGTILNKAAWDGTNVEWSTAALYFTGASPTVRNVTITNVNKVGVGFQNCNGTCRAIGVTITGNYPAADWTETETAHFGVAFDPGATASVLLASECTITSCVQGIFLGNYGTGSSAASIVKANIIRECWNHGVYNAGGCTGVVTQGNAFVDCSRQIAMSDGGHSVIGNVMVTTGTGSTLNAASINMRNATDCVIADNVITGDCWSGAAIIDFNHVSGGTVCTGNQIRGNRITVTGTNAGFAIRVGTTATATWANNTIEGNIVQGPGTASAGLISLYSAGGGAAGKVKGNTVTATGNCYGIYGYGMIGLQVHGNTYVNQYNAGSAVVVGGVVFAGTCTGCETKLNQFITLAGYGANSTIRCIWENGSGVTDGRIAGNTFTLGSTTATSQATHVLGAGSPVIDEVLDVAPAFIAGPGSQVRVTTGGASTTLYIKETAYNSATWRAV